MTATAEATGGALERPLELLEREITELAAHIHAATCRWLALVAEFDRREGWGSWGCKSCAHWLAHTCALGSVAAREHVRVARRLHELPAIKAAFGRGELSYSQVRALSRVATAELEPGLLELARHSTASQLERVLRAYAAVIRRELGADDAAHGDRYMVCEHDDDGSLLIRARLPADEGALVMKALAAARESLREGCEPRESALSGCQRSTDLGPQASSAGRGVSAESESPQTGITGTLAPPSNADALVLCAETLLASGPLTRPGADAHQVVVHVDAAVLASSDPAAAGPDGAMTGSAGRCELEHGELLDPATARRLGCDASIVRILERDGRPLSVGRRTRSIPPALRTALASRDSCCRFPGCDQRRFLHAHHIHHWAHGGPTELANLIQLCRYHHRLVHEGGYGIQRGAGGALHFTRPDGRALPAVPTPLGGTTDELVRANTNRPDKPPDARDIGPETCVRRWDGTRLDLPLTIDTLVQRDPRLPED